MPRGGSRDDIDFYPCPYCGRTGHDPDVCPVAAADARDALRRAEERRHDDPLQGEPYHDALVRLIRLIESVVVNAPPLDGPVERRKRAYSLHYNRRMRSRKRNR